MLEIIMIIAAVVLMAKAADIEKFSPWIWGGVTLLICFLCLWIPLPMIRIGIATVLSIAAMIVFKMTRKA